MGWLNFGGKKRDRAQGFGDSSKTKSRKRPKSFILEKIVTPSAGFGDWEHEFDQLHQLLGSLSLSDLHLPNFFADGGVCPIDPDAPTNNLPPLIDFDPLGLYHDGIATQTPYNPGGAFETLPIALIPVDPQSPNPNNPNAIRQLLNFPLANQPLLGSIDTGVSADSPYLNYANIKKGRDYVGGDDNPLLKPGEGSEHGTFMLGIIDAINKTAPKWVGRAIDSGRWADSLVEFVDAAKASGQKNAIANLSLDLTQKNPDGSVTTRYELTPAERSAIEYARQNGVMLVVAAGNDGGVMSVLGQASQEFDNIFTVGAGDINGRSIYSSYGRGLDIVADGGTTEHPGLSTVGNDLGTMAGTSVATAKVAGVASLVWAANPALNYRQVMEILKSTARDLGPSGWDDETGFGFLNTLAAVDLAKKTTPEVYNPTPWVTPGTWSGEGKVTPEERAAKGGNSIAAATVQVLTNFSDSDRVDGNQPDKYYQFTVNEPGYVKWNLTSLNPVSGFPTPPNVTIIKADGKPGSHIFSKGISLGSSMMREGQTSFSGGDFYNSGTYYLKVGGGAWSTFKDYNISTQFTADRVSSFAGNVQYRTQPYYSLQDSPQSAVFSGPAVSELKNLAGVVTYDNIQVNNRIAKYGIEVNESGKFRINLNSPNGKMELSVNKFIGSEDRPVQLSGLGVAANSDGWLELQLNKGRYDIEVKTPSNFWQEPDWNSTQQRLVRPYTLNATFTPNAPQPGQGKVPASAGAFDKTVVSGGVVNHYYKNGYLTVQPSGQASWYGYPSLVISGSAQVINEPVPLTDPDGNDIEARAKEFFPPNVASRTIGNSLGGNDRIDYYKFTLQEKRFVNFSVDSLSAGVNLLVRDPQKNQGDSINSSGTDPINWNRILDPGTYYVAVSLGQDAISKGLKTEYTLGISANPPKGQLFQGSSSGSVYLIQNDQRQQILNPGVDLAAMGISLDRVWKVPDQDLNGIPPGQPLSPLIPQWQKSIDDAANQNSLGNPVTSYWDAADSPTGTKGYGRTYDRGSVYWTAKSGAIALVGQFADAYHNPNGGSNGWLGFPTAKQWNWEGGQRIDFEGGYIYRTVQEGIRAFKYDESPWQKSIDAEYAGHQGLLGNPTTGYWDAADSPTGTKGRGQNYNYGTVLWTAKSGAIALWREFADTYNQNGGSNGWLGFPTKGKEDWQGGQRIEFEGGYIYWTAKEGARAFKNGELPWEKSIAAEYAGHQGLLGNPTTGYWDAADSPTGTKGRGQNYNYGTVLWTAKSGAIALWGDFANTYNQNGGSNKWLGFPTQGKRDWLGGERIDFEGGYIYRTAQEGTRAFKHGELPAETINRKPVINFPDFQMPYGTSFSLQTYADRLQISDPDGDAIQFYEISVDPSRVGMEAWTLEGQPLGKFLIPADQFNSIKFYGSVLGSNPVVIRAFDGKEWSDPKSFNINVVPSSNTGGVTITPGNGSAGSSGNTGNSGGGSSNNSTTNTNSGSNPIIFNNNYNKESNFPLIYASSTNNLNKVVKVVPENFSGPLPFLSIRQGNVFGSIYYFNFLAKGISILVPDEPQLKNKTSWLKGELERNNLLGQFSDSQFGEITLLSGTPLSLFFTEDKVVFTSKLNDTVVRNNAKYTGTRSYQEAINRGILASSDYHYLSPEAFVEYLRAGTSISSSLVRTKEFADAVLKPSPMPSIEKLRAMKDLAKQEWDTYKTRYPNLWKEFGAYNYILDSYSSAQKDLISSMLFYLEEDEKAREFIGSTIENFSASLSAGFGVSKTKSKYLEKLFALSESYAKIQKEDPRLRNEIAQQEFIKLALKLLSNDAADIYSLYAANDKQKDAITLAMTKSAGAAGASIGGLLGGPGGAILGTVVADLAARYAAPLVNEAVNDAKKAVEITVEQLKESDFIAALGLKPSSGKFDPFNWLYRLLTNDPTLFDSY